MKKVSRWLIAAFVTTLSACWVDIEYTPPPSQEAEQPERRFVQGEHGTDTLFHETGNMIVSPSGDRAWMDSVSLRFRFDALSLDEKTLKFGYGAEIVYKTNEQYDISIEGGGRSTNVFDGKGNAHMTFEGSSNPIKIVVEKSDPNFILN